MFNFRIIHMADGNKIIDETFTTPYSALTPALMAEYRKVEVQLKFARNPLYKLTHIIRDNVIRKGRKIK